MKENIIDLEFCCWYHETESILKPTYRERDFMVKYDASQPLNVRQLTDHRLIQLAQFRAKLWAYRYFKSKFFIGRLNDPCIK